MEKEKHSNGSWFLNIINEIFVKSELLFAYSYKGSSSVTLKVYKPVEAGNGKNLNSDEVQYFMEATLCDSVYKSIVGDSDYKTAIAKRSCFVKGKYDEDRVKKGAMLQLRSIARNSTSRVMNEQTNKIKELMESTAYYECYSNGAGQLKNEWERRKERYEEIKKAVADTDYQFVYERIKKKLTEAFKASATLKSLMGISGDVPSESIEKVLAGLILLATFYNDFVFFELRKGYANEIEALLQKDSQSQNAKEAKKRIEEAENSQKSIVEQIRQLVFKKEEIDIFKTLAKCYWGKYREIGAQKQNKHTQLNLQRRLGEVYQKPELIPLCEGDRFGWEDGITACIKVVAPNGYGKSAFSRVLLLSQLLEYIEELSPKEHETFEDIRNTFALPEKSLPLYLECKDIKHFLNSKNYETGEWIFDTLDFSLHLPGDIKKEDLQKSIFDHAKVFLIIDGLDEISKEERELLVSALIALRSKVNRNGLCILITTRPLSLSSDIDMGRCREWTLKSIRSYSDYEIESFVRAYAAGKMDTTKIVGCIRNNHYIKELISTPSIFVWTLLKLSHEEPVSLIVDSIIHELLSRNVFAGERTGTDVMEATLVYQRLSHKFLLRLKKPEGIVCASFMKWLTDEIRLMTTDERTEENLVNYLNKQMKDMDALETLFFSELSILEFENGILRFSSLVFALHLAAIWAINYADSFSCEEALSELHKYDYHYRYRVLVIILSMADAISYDIDRSIETYNLSELMGTAVVEYMMAQYSLSEVSEEEKKAIASAADDIMNRRYGENVIRDSRNGYRHVAVLQQMVNEMKID